MPRDPSKGPVIQKRVKPLLEALLGFADGEFEDSGFKIEYDWKEEDSANPKLTIQTTLVTLESLTQKDKYLDKLNKDQIRQALNLLKDFLKILEDNRLQTKGVEDWHFTLKLWSRDREKNLKRFDEAWENSRSKKSKELEANFTQNEDIAIAPQTKLAIFQAPPLPTHFVERPEYSDDLKARLLTESSDSRALVITAIHGLGSVGKSTLAAALAHDAEIQTRFCDGILWATLGQQPDVLSLVSGWVQALGDYSFKPTSVEATVSQLRTLLYDKAVLLVVDDAWNTQDAQAFNVGGVRCQVLVTTREAVIADALSASIYNVDIMTPTQAMELLTKKLRREITGRERQSAENLAQGVGYLPLALELAAAEVASGTTWDELLGDIQQEVARLKSFDRPEAGEITDEASLKRLSLTASLNLSIKRMPTEKQQQFSYLGVLPEDVNINKIMAATLWEMDERDAAKMLQYLRNKALLLTGVPLDGMPTYRLHDLFHDLARNLLTAPPQPKRQGDLLGLGISLADAHAVLLAKYRQKIQNNLWHTLPNDGYIHQHLIRHLENAGQVAEIHQLLREESATRNNGWYEVREKLGQTGGYITDISRAWKLAEKNWNKSTLPQVVGLQCRYALMIASLNSLAANIPIELLVALVKNNVWTAEQGLAYALQNPEPTAKVNTLAELVNYLPPNLEKLALKEVLAAARAIQHEKHRANALSALADKLPSELLPEALAAARAIQHEEYRANALGALVDKLPEVLPEALAAAKTMKNEYHRAQVLSALADKLPSRFLLSELLPKALAVARTIKDDRYRVQALSALADKLPEVLPEALAIARAIKYGNSRAQALSALADKLPDTLPEALAATRTIEDEYDCTQILSSLADKLPSELLPKALAVARAIKNDRYRVQVLSVLADKVPEVLPEALAIARTIKDEYYRAQVLIALADKLPETLPETLPEALAATMMIRYKYRAKALSALVDKLPSEFLQEALAVARAIKDDRYRVEALSALAEKLPPELLPEALAAARAIHSEYYRTQALSALVDKLPPELLPEALAAARAIHSEYYRTQALSALADKLPEVLPQALAVARAIKDERLRIQTLSALADKLPEVLPQALAAARAIKNEINRVQALSALADKLPEVLPETLAATMMIQSEHHRTPALSALANKLPPELLPEALTAVRAIKDEKDRVPALSVLADKLPSELLPEALTAARTIKDEYHRTQALSALADKLSSEVLPEALAAARTIKNEYERTQALSALANKLPPELLPEALAAARTIEFESYRTQVLRALANKLPPELLPEALAAARAIQHKEYRAKALSALADKLPEVLPEALATARAIHSEYLRTQALSALAYKLPPELLPEALAATRAIKDEKDRVQALSALADKLPPELLPEALAAARAIQHGEYRTQVLRALANKLPLELLPEALAAARAIHSEYYRTQALRALANKLPLELLSEALAAARTIEFEYYRTQALSALANKLPEVLPEALAATKAIKDDRYRVQALSALADKLPLELLPEALAVARAIKYDRADALSALASGLSQITSAELFCLWQDTLHELSLRTRPDLLQDIKALFPVIFALGGEAATAELARAIVDVARWWK